MFLLGTMKKISNEPPRITFFIAGCCYISAVLGGADLRKSDRENARARLIRRPLQP